MKYFIYIFAITLLLTSCSEGNVKDSKIMELFANDNIDTDYTTNIAGIKQKKREMLAVADNVGNFWFSDDVDFQMQDPHAYWLMNRMMQMVQLIQTADDGWAWMLAMNESVEKYNSRLGRKIGSVNAATNAIGELIDIYTAGNQPQMNTASYVIAMLAHYKTIYEYYNIIESIYYYGDDNDWDKQLRALCYREYKEWFDLNNAVNGIMTFYTEASSFHSALPMEMNGQFEFWSKKRLEELAIEGDILYNSYDWTSFKSDAKSISAKKFDSLICYLKDINEKNVVEQKMQQWDEEKDYEFISESIEGMYDYDKIAEMVNLYETAISNWRKVRKQITRLLPKEKRKSYREITKQMHTRLYYDLDELKEIRY